MAVIHGKMLLHLELRNSTALHGFKTNCNEQTIQAYVHIRPNQDSSTANEYDATAPINKSAGPPLGFVRQKTGTLCGRHRAPLTFVYFLQPCDRQESMPVHMRVCVLLAVSCAFHERFRGARTCACRQPYRPAHEHQSRNVLKNAHILRTMHRGIACPTLKQ